MKCSMGINFYELHVEVRERRWSRERRGRRNQGQM
jgi:hypothetical protein